MGNEVRLKIGGDTTDLENAVKSAFTKIQKDAEKLKVNTSAAANRPAPGGSQEYQTFQKAFQATRAQEQKSRAEQDALQRTKRELENVGRQLATNARLTAAEAKTEKDRNFYATERNRLEREYQTLVGTRKRLEGSIGTSPAGSQAAPGMGGLTRVLGATVGGVGLGMAASATGEGIRKFFSEAENRSRVAGASAFQTQGQAGQRLNSILNGGANEEMMFDPIRAQAAKIADETMKNRLESQFRIGTRPIETLFGRGSTHSTSNAIPGAFTIDQFGLGTENLKKEIENKQAKERADIQAEQFDALKNGPEGGARSAIGNKFLQEWRGNLDFQRQQGLTESGFRSFLGGVNGMGFSNEQGMASASGILGAGGSTRSAQGNAGFALQMQRQFDLTNSGQALGAISGQLGSSQMTKEAMIKIQAEGTRIGLNQSDLREENRRFVEMAASVIGQSTATSGAGVDQLTETLSRFMGSNTITGQQAGLSAYQAYQSQSNIQSGPSAAIRAAGMVKDKTIGKLSGEDQASLFTMNQADVNVDDPGIQAMARKAGVSPEDFVNAYHKVQNSSLFQRKSSDAAISNLADAYRKKGPLASGDDYAQTFQNIDAAEGTALNKMPLEQAAGGLNRKAQLALARARASGDDNEISRILGNQGVSGQIGAGTGRPGDDMERQQAEASRLANGLFMSFRDSITPASDAVVRFAGAIDTLLRAMNGTSDNRAAALKMFNNQYPGMTPTTQPSTGPTSSGGGTGASVGH